MLQACLNGSRTDGVPRTPAALASAARASVAAGAEDLHVHPKDPDGRDSLQPSIVDAAVAAVRSAVPGVPVGVTTGAWALGVSDASRLIPQWTMKPDHASVNWHEDQAEEMAAALLSAGIAVHAGLWLGTDGAERFQASPLRGRVGRILAEVLPSVAGSPDDATVLAWALELRGTHSDSVVLLHGEEELAWPVLRLARSHGFDARIGLEDTLVLPDGSPAPDNAALVRAALAVPARSP